MINEQNLISKWQKLDLDEQKRVLDFIESISSKATPQESHYSYQPKTKLGQKLWELRLKSLGEQPLLTTWDEVEQELALRRGGIQE